MYRKLCFLLLTVALAAGGAARDPDFFFAVLADPQLCFWNPNEFPHEEAAVKLAVAELNRLKPRFVVGERGSSRERPQEKNASP